MLIDFKRLLTTLAILDAAPAICFILAFISARTSSSVDDVLLFIGACTVGFGYIATGLYTRNEFVAAGVPAACALYTLVGNMLPYELGVFGTTIEDRFQDNETFDTWREGYFIGFFFVYTFLIYAAFAGIGFTIRLTVYLLRWTFGETDEVLASECAH